MRELALCNLGVDSKLPGCDLVTLKVLDMCRGDRVMASGVKAVRRNEQVVRLRDTRIVSPACRAMTPAHAAYRAMP